MLFHTETTSTAVDGVFLPLVSRNVQIAWKTGSVATYEVRKRDQFKVLAMRLFTNDLSWGRFANWAKETHEWQYC